LLFQISIHFFLLKPSFVAQGMQTEKITSQQFSTSFDNMDNIRFSLLMQMCWYETWQAKYRTTHRFCVLPYTPFLRPDGIMSLLHALLKTTMLWTPKSSPTPQKRNFEWQAKHQLCNSGSRSMTGTENERQEERNGKEGGARGTQVLSRRRKLVWREYIKIDDSRSYFD
jgi:hypothetical protein